MSIINNGYALFNYPPPPAAIINPDITVINTSSETIIIPNIPNIPPSVVINMLVKLGYSKPMPTGMDGVVCVKLINDSNPDITLILEPLSDEVGMLN